MLARRAQLSQVLDLIDKGLIVEADAERVLDVIEVENVMLDRLNALIDRLLALFPDRPSPPLH